jgi:hypothetical protein
VFAGSLANAALLVHLKEPALKLGLRDAQPVGFVCDEIRHRLIDVGADRHLSLTSTQGVCHLLTRAYILYAPVIVAAGTYVLYRVEL